MKARCPRALTPCSGHKEGRRENGIHPGWLGPLLCYDGHGMSGSCSLPLLRNIMVCLLEGVSPRGSDSPLPAAQPWTPWMPWSDARLR